MHAQQQDTGGKTWSASVGTEVNYGHLHHAQHSTMWDFPHIWAGGEVRLGQGWSVAGEVEYERFYTDGEWQNDFADNFWVNYLYLAKSWSEQVNVKAGIVPVPVGLLNGGGDVLTIYDSESEMALLSTGWHEAGAAFYGSSGKWAYNVAALAYLDKHAQMLGASARADYQAADCLRLGASAYWGDTRRGTVGYQAPYFERGGGIFYGSADFAVDANGLVGSGSVIYASKMDACSAGIEAGYNVLEHSNVPEMSIIPFARCEGVWNTGDDIGKYTLGVNVEPLEGFLLKGEYYWRHHNAGCTERGFNLGIGYSIDF